MRKIMSVISDAQQSCFSADVIVISM